MVVGAVGGVDAGAARRARAADPRCRLAGAGIWCRADTLRHPSLRTRTRPARLGRAAGERAQGWRSTTFTPPSDELTGRRAGGILRPGSIHRGPVRRHLRAPVEPAPGIRAR